MLTKTHLPSDVHGSFINNGETWKQPKCSSIGEWINKLWCIHPMKYYSTITKGNELKELTTTWINLKKLCWGKEGRCKSHMYILYDSTYTKFKKGKTNLWQIKNQRISGRERGKLTRKIHKGTFWNYDNIVHVDNILYVD